MGVFKSVRKMGGCPRCRKPDFCSFMVLENGNVMLLCRRDTTANVQRARDGVAIHILTNLSIATSRVEISTPLRAHIDRRHAVYSAMLAKLSLDEADEQNLLGRGLSRIEIEALGYKSAADIASELNAAGFILDRVPGFYQDGDGWRSAALPGFFIPILDREKRIQALQVRTHDKKQKYKWFSSNDLPRGSSSGLCLHYRLAQGDALWITESPLKADVTAMKLGVPVVAGAGVNARHDEIAAATFDFEKVVIAFDGNWRTNRWVRHAIECLQEKIQKRRGIRAEVAVWDGTDGIDDALLSNRPIEVVSFVAWQELASKPPVKKR